jgi:multidrug resistance efflux pump
MSKNRFDRVKGTKDFLVAAVVCTFICLWAVRDAWFPTEKILKKHPLEFPVTVSVSGVVQEIPVEAGDEVGGETPLIILSSGRLKEAVEAAEQAYKDARGSGEEILKEKLNALVRTREDLGHATVRAADFVLKTTHGEEPLQGRVLEVFAAPASRVEAGDTVMLIKPKDTFYIFNKSLSVLMFVLAIVFFFFHRVASK